MAQPYRKRMKGDWNQGKACKGDSEERQYSKREIQEQLDEAEEKYLHRYHKGKRTKNEKARLEYRIHWYQQALERYRELGGSYASHLEDGLVKAKKELLTFTEENP
jgi:predicted nuclease with TOPRIM domain